MDSTRARLFLYDRSAEPEGLVERFVERVDLVNPAPRHKPSEAAVNEFAASIGHEVAALVRDTGAMRLVLCASERMLDKVRRATSAVPSSVTVQCIARDLVKLPPNQLRDQLASYTLLPQRA